MTARTLLTSPLVRWLALALAALVLAYRQTSYARHDRTLRAMRDALAAVPLPRGAAVVDRFEQLGVLSGNGNHCDYVVALRLSANVDPLALARQLRNRSLRVRDGEGTFEAEVEVWPAETPPDAYDPARGLLPERWIERSPSRRPSPVVYAFRGGEPPAHDFRCH